MELGSHVQDIIVGQRVQHDFFDHGQKVVQSTNWGKRGGLGRTEQTAYGHQEHGGLNGLQGDPLVKKGSGELTGRATGREGGLRGKAVGLQGLEDVKLFGSHDREEGRGRGSRAKCSR